MEARKAKDSFTTMNELVLPNDTNTFGDLMGGKLMYWMDIAAYLSAAKHCNSACMTASTFREFDIDRMTSFLLNESSCIMMRENRFVGHNFYRRSFA